MSRARTEDALERITELCGKRGELRRQLRWGYNLADVGTGAGAIGERRSTSPSDPTSGQALDRQRKRIEKAVALAERHIEIAYGALERASGGPPLGRDRDKQGTFLAPGEFEESEAMVLKREAAGGGYGA